MRARKSKTTTYSRRVPWQPIHRRMVTYTAAQLYVYRDDDGMDWWSDGFAIFRGEAPGYLRKAYRASGRPVDVAGQPLLFSVYANLGQGTRLAAPIAGYEVTRMISHDVVPVAVFAAGETDPELHVDARYLAYAEARFTGCTFWRIARSAVAVRTVRGLVGIVEGRKLPPKSVHGAAS